MATQRALASTLPVPMRRQNESLDLLCIWSRIEAVESRMETALTMRQVMGNMNSVVKNMDRLIDRTLGGRFN